MSNMSTKTPEQIGRNVKVVLLGDSGVGKTCIIQRYVKGTYIEEENPTLGASFASKILKFDQFDNVIKIDIWDTAGQEKYKSIAKIYYKNADCIIFVYDITRKKSFEGIKNYYELVKASMTIEKVKFVIVGNKSDLYEKEAVNPDEAKDFARTIGAAFYQTSAKNNAGIDELFKDIGMDLLQTENENDNSIKIEKSTFIAGRKAKMILEGDEKACFC